MNDFAVVYTSGTHSTFSSCAGVNAAICIKAVLENSFKLSAFVFQHRNKLCRWRHLLPLSAENLRAGAAGIHYGKIVYTSIIYSIRFLKPQLSFLQQHWLQLWPVTQGIF